MCAACLGVVVLIKERVGAAELAGLAVTTFLAMAVGSPVAYLVQLPLIGVFGAIPPMGRAGVFRTVSIGAVAGAVVTLGLFAISQDKPVLGSMLLGTLLGAGSAFTYCVALGPEGPLTRPS